MATINNPKTFLYGRQAARPRKQVFYDNITRLEEAEARAATGDPQEQIELIADSRERRGRSER